MTSMRGVLLDALIAMIILIIGTAVFARIAGVEEGETAPVWVQFGPLVLAVIYLGWRTVRRSRQRQEAEQRARELREREDEAGEPMPQMVGEVEPAAPLPLSDFEWRSRVDSVIRNLGSGGFRRFALEFLPAIGLSDIRVERTAFDGAVECVAASADAGGDVYVILRRSYGALGASQVRELRERMRERDCDGLYITNGDFTASARAEAVGASGPDGAARLIRLIDGDELAELMRERAVGVELDDWGNVIAIDEAWFRSLETERQGMETDDH